LFNAGSRGHVYVHVLCVVLFYNVLSIPYHNFARYLLFLSGSLLDFGCRHGQTRAIDFPLKYRILVDIKSHGLFLPLCGTHIPHQKHTWPYKGHNKQPYSRDISSAIVAFAVYGEMSQNAEALGMQELISRQSHPSSHCHQNPPSRRRPFPDPSSGPSQPQLEPCLQVNGRRRVTPWIEPARRD